MAEDEACVSEAWDVDPASRDQLRLLLDEHRRLAQAGAAAPAEPAAAGMLPPGRFDVLEHLGSGAFGDVYRVLDKASDSVVALKLLRDPRSSALYYFKREFRGLADIRHPNIAALHELIQHRQHWMFTMEFVAGTSLGRYIDGGSMSERESRLRACFLQLAAGLHFLHERDLVHRDMKPSNVLVTREGRVVILDFGLARSFAGDDGRAGTLAGTPEYMSPEHIGGEPVTRATDWYALGVMLYEALTGALPFTGSWLALLQRKQLDTPGPPSALAPIAPDLNELCVGLLSRDPRARYGFAEASRVLSRGRSSVAASEPARHLIGRASELRRLRAAYDAVQVGCPAVAHISGSSGIGKTSLIREFVASLEHDGSMLALRGRCYEGESVPYQGLDDLVDDLTQHLRRLDPDTLQQIVPRNFGVLTRMFPVLAQLPARPHGGNLPVDSHELRRLAFGALRELLGRLAERTRVVLAIDDLQWGDMDGCAFFVDLLAGAEAPAVLLLLAYRAEAIATSPWLTALRERPSLPRAAVSVDIELAPLESSDATRLAEMLARTTAPLTPAAIEEVAQQSGGEPFLIHEIMRWINAGGGDRTLAGQFSLADVIRARMNDMGADTLHLLQLVAIAGQPIERSVIQAAFPSRTFAGSRDRLLRERLVRPQLVQGREVLEIYHDRIRAVLVSLLDAAIVADRHRELARAFEASDTGNAEQVAMHLYAAGDFGQAAAQALKAAAQAMEAFAFNKAASLYTIALATDTLDPDTRRVAHQRMGDALASADKGPEAASAYLAAAEGAAEHDAIRLRINAASQLLRCGHIHRGIAMLEALVRQTGLTVLRSRTARLAHVAWLRTRLAARGLRFEEKADPRLSDEATLRLDVCWTGAIGTSMIEPLRSAEFSAQYVLLALQSGDPYRILLALAGESTQICHVPSGGDRRTSYALIAQAQEMAARIGDPYAQAFTTLMKSIISFLHGDWRGAAALADAASDQLRAECTNVAWEQSTAAIIAFNARALCGDCQLNRDRMPALIRDAEDRGDLHRSISLRLVSGAHVLDLADDEPERARQQVRQDLARWGHVEYRPATSLRTARRDRREPLPGATRRGLGHDRG